MFKIQGKVNVYVVRITKDSKGDCGEGCLRRQKKSPTFWYDNKRLTFWFGDLAELSSGI